MGIDRYGDAAVDPSDAIRNLATAVKDATQLAGRLKVLGYEVVTLTDKDATGPRILDEIERIHRGFEGSSGLNRFVFYFAGHGLALAASEDHGLPRGKVVPYGVTRSDRSGLLDMADLRNALEGPVNSKARPHHALIVLDCCFAGAFREASARDFEGINARLYKSQLDHFTERRAWQILCSAAFDQRALDTVDGYAIGERGLTKGNHSPFAGALLRGLEGDADAKFKGEDGQDKGDGVITATELYLHLRISVAKVAQRQGHSQTPQLWTGNLHDGGEFVFIVGKLDTAPDPEIEQANNPYQGLRTYETKDAGTFFGRAETTARLVERVRETPLTAVVGASGAGKSSILAAGLVPSLGSPPPAPASGAAEAPGPFVIVGPLRPGASPLQSLASALGEAATRLEVELQVADLADAMRRDPARLATLLQAWTEPPSGSPRYVALVIDQAEELWTLASGEDARRAFMDALAHVVSASSTQTSPARLRVVLALRSDFEATLAPQQNGKTAWDKVGEVWRSAPFQLPAMTPQEMREVMERSAATAGVYFEPYGLMNEILDGVRGMPGALPLLSVTLRGLYEACVKRQLAGQSAGRGLQRHEFVEMKGVAGVIGAQAQAAHDLLGPAEKETMRRLLLRMVPIGSEVVPRRVRQAELELVSDDEKKLLQKVEEQTRIRRVKALLVDRRLLTTDSEDGTAFVELAHAALTAWPPLATWRDVEASWLPVHRELTATALAYDAHRTTGTLQPNLWRGDRLAVATKKRSAEPELLSRVEEQLLDVSVTWQRVRWAGGITLGVGVIVALGVIAAVQRDRAIESDARALAAQAAVALRTDPHSSLGLAVRAWDTRPVPEAEHAIRAALSRDRLQGVLTPHDGALRLASFTESGERILLVGEKGISVWSTAPITPITRWPVANVTHAVLADDGERFLGLRTGDKVAELWVVGHEAPAQTHHGAVNIHRGPDGHLRVVLEENGKTRVHDVEAARDVRTLDGQFASMSQDGARIVVATPELGLFTVDGGDAGAPLASRSEDDCPGARMVWHTSAEDANCNLWTSGEDIFFSGTSALRLAPSSGFLPALFLSPKTHGGAALGEWRTFYWMNTPAPPVLLPDTGEATAALFEPDGFSFLGVDAEGLRFWHVAIGSGNEERPHPTDLSGPRGRVLSLAWSAVGSLAAAGSSDHTASVWAKPPTALGRVVPLVTVIHHDAAVQSVAFHPQQPLLLTATAGGAAYLWRVGAAATSEPNVASQTSASGVDALVVGNCRPPVEKGALRASQPDGHMIATGTQSGEIQLCDVTDGKVKGAFFGHATRVSSLRWADKRFLVSGDVDGVVQVIDTESSMELMTEAVGGIVSDAVLAPDRRSIAVQTRLVGGDAAGSFRIAFLGALDPAALVAAARAQLKIE